MSAGMNPRDHERTFDRASPHAPRRVRRPNAAARTMPAPLHALASGCFPRAGAARVCAALVRACVRVCARAFVRARARARAPFERASARAPRRCRARAARR
eukprot:6187728-Pleurochrysis_carterae.AAC.1